MGLWPLNVLAVSVVVFLCSTVDGQAPIVFCSGTQDASPDFTWLKLKALWKCYTLYHLEQLQLLCPLSVYRTYLLRARGMCRLSEEKYPGACSECLRAAQFLTADECGPLVAGAHVNFVICQMRFENYVFSDG